MRLQFFPTQESWTMNNNVLKVSVLALFLGLAGGCATTGGDDAAGAANQAAEAARAAADRAAQAAADAQSSADQALSAATEAQACCEANRETMERMFQKVSSK
jgi:Flp pilus assembly protein TadG